MYPCNTTYEMTNFLGMHRGAALYEVRESDPSEGEILGSKVIAKALVPNHENMRVDFIEEAATRDEALDKLKKRIDRYLDKHQLREFVNEIL